MDDYSRIRADIDLDALNDNLNTYLASLPAETKAVAVLKANAYGHGAVPIGRFLETRDDVWGFAVATAGEGAELRASGIRKPILLLGISFPESFGTILDERLTACICDEESAVLLSEKAAAAGRRADVHLKIDTGMGRIGFADRAGSVDAIRRICALPGLHVQGVFTHFARADEEEIAPAEEQLARFLTFLSLLRKEGIEPELVHCCNSAAGFRMKKAGMSLARLGVSLYGMPPSAEIADGLNLKPVMSLVSHISFLKDVQPGCAISYGGTFVAERPMRVATVPVGYGDGYPRTLSGRGSVLIRGKRVPILGRVCMDQFMVDVTGIPDAARGDEVVLIGRQGDEEITAMEVSEMSGRFHYELTCDITDRVPRCFLKDGVRCAVLKHRPELTKD